MTLRVDGVLHRLRVVRHDTALVVILHGRNHMLRPSTRWRRPAATMSAATW